MAKDYFLELDIQEQIKRHCLGRKILFVCQKDVLNFRQNKQKIFDNILLFEQSEQFHFSISIKL